VLLPHGLYVVFAALCFWINSLLMLFKASFNDENLLSLLFLSFTSFLFLSLL
jgi:hypothetical protein